MKITELKVKLFNSSVVKIIRGNIQYCKSDTYILRGGFPMNQFKAITECPKCGGVELGKGKHHGYAVMHPTNKMSFGSEVEYILCTDCGYIIESYVKKPEKFKGTL